MNRARVIVFVIILINLISLSAWGASVEQWTCSDTPVTERQLEYDFKGQGESAAATFTITGLTLNKSLLKDAEAMFGPSTPTNRSSDHGELYE
jgi:hypothetical protein